MFVIGYISIKWYNTYMPKSYISANNPHGLSPKQRAVVIDVVENIRAGKGLNVTASVAKIHQTKHPGMIASKHLSRQNFREALIEELYRSKTIGKNSKVNQVLTQGLDAIKYTKDGDIAGEDFSTRLAYVQEINKITGVYAPDRQDKRVVTMNVDFSDEELSKRIQELQNQVL